MNVILVTMRCIKVKEEKLEREKVFTESRYTKPYPAGPPCAVHSRHLISRARSLSQHTPSSRPPPRFKKINQMQNTSH